MKISAIDATKNYIRKRAGSNVLTAVNKANLTLEEGVLTVLSGPSGSGKSTLLTMMAGLLPPTSGQILADGQDLYAMEDKQLSAFRNVHIGLIPQGQTALMSLNVLENVLVPYTLYHPAKGKAYEEALLHARQMLEQAGMASLEKEMPSELSGGEIRRMAVCRAMMSKPEIVLADEPTGDLDEENTKAVMELLKGCAQDGAAVLVVTHDKQVREYADKILQMKEGVISFGLCNI